MSQPGFSRRSLLELLAAAPFAALATRGDASALPLPADSPAGQVPVAPTPLKVGVVSRHLQWTSLEDAIELAKVIGFDAIEWNVRKGGHIEPERVATELPRAVALTRKAGLAVEMVTTAIQDAQSPQAEAILAAMHAEGIRVYRSGEYFRYDYAKPIRPQIEALRPRFAGLAALNAKHATTVAYHTHSGRSIIGGNIWDFWMVLDGMDPARVGLNYDGGHATLRGGAGWPEAARMVLPHIVALAVKDARWERAADGRWRSEFVPLGEGMVDYVGLLTLLKGAGFAGPINLHFEHSGLLGTDVGTWTLGMSREQFIATLRKDLETFRGWMAKAGVA